MSPAWLDDVDRFSEVLEATQQELLATLRQKRQALVTGSVAEMQTLNQMALEVSQRLKSLTGWRTELLSQAHRAGYPDETLTDVLSREMSVRHDQLRARFAAVQQRFGEARREAWIQWIIAQKAGGYYADVVELLAQGGHRSPVYGDGAGLAPATGGAMLDAAV